MTKSKLEETLFGLMISEAKNPLWTGDMEAESGSKELIHILSLKHDAERVNCE